MTFQLSILHKSLAGRYRPVRVADGPITTRCRFIKNASLVSPIIASSANTSITYFPKVFGGHFPKVFGGH